MAKYTSIGGQALIEGIMMKSPEKTALAVRMPDKSIDITYLNGKSVREKYKILKLPILRGIAGFIESMLQGYKAMMLSADKSGFTDLDEEEKEKTESEKKLGDLLPDLTHDLIASTIIIGQGMPNKFSSFSPSGRKELLEKLTKSDFMIEDIKNRIALRQNELSRKIQECSDSILVNGTKLSAAKKDLERIEKELTETVKPDFDKYNNI